MGGEPEDAPPRFVFYQLEGPPEEAYERFTLPPERYAPLVDVVGDWIAAVTETYDVVVSQRDDVPEGRGYRLVPRAGAPVKVLVSPRPEVVLEVGRWTRAWFPDCGCDACDHEGGDVEHQTGQLAELLADVVAGRLVEVRHGDATAIERAGSAVPDVPASAERVRWDAWPRRG